MFAKGKKVFAVFLSAVMLVSAFTACSESSGNSSSSDNTSSFAETYVYNSVSVNPLGREGEDGTINLKVWGPDAAQESLREQCDEFCQIMKEYGDIKIEVIGKNCYGTRTTRIIVRSSL